MQGLTLKCWQVLKSEFLEVRSSAGEQALRKALQIHRRCLGIDHPCTRRLTRETLLVGHEDPWVLGAEKAWKRWKSKGNVKKKVCFPLVYEPGGNVCRLLDGSDDTESVSDWEVPEDGVNA